MQTQARAIWIVWLLAPALLGALAALVPAQTSAQSSPLPNGGGSTLSGPLSLEQLISLASQYSPEMPIAQARVAAARGRMIQAGLYPNPFFSWDAEDMGDPINGSGTQGPTVIQEFVTARKLRLAQSAASQGVVAADWAAVSRWFDLLTRVRAAYFEALTAQRAVKTHEEIVRLVAEGLEVARKLLKAGTGTQPDVLRAQVELEQSRLDLAVASQRAEAAWRTLAAVIGLPTAAEVPLAGSLEVQAPAYDWTPVLATVLTRSSEVQEAQSLVVQADGLVRLARAQAVPNLLVGVRPFYDFPAKNTQARAEVGSALPIFNRNQGNIRTAEADLVRFLAQVRQVELRLSEQLAAAFRRYEAARRQTEAYRLRILPHAAESLRLIVLGYKSGDPKYDYTAVLQAQRILIQNQLAYVQALGDLWRGITDIGGLLQLDDLAAPGPPVPPPR